MKVDLRVTKVKFEEEVKRLEAQVATLGKRGIFISSIEFPLINVIFIPRISLKLHVPMQHKSGAPLPPRLARPPGTPPDSKMQLMGIQDVPSLSARAFGARISLDDFDQRAPSVVFCDPFSWEEIPYAKLHRGQHIGENGKPFNVVLGDHPLTKKPFLCMRGIREYHEHPQHTGDDWMLYRKHVGLFPTIDIIWKTCVLNAIPNLILNPPQIQVVWGNVGPK